MFKPAFYAGIGSRDTPDEVRRLMRLSAHRLQALGYFLRSGGAPGADQAFEAGCSRHARQVFLPWPGFQGNDSALYDLPNFDEAQAISERFHPTWAKLRDSHRKLHGRNAYQVLGFNLRQPARFVLCWTPDGVEDGRQTTWDTGGTGQAIRIAAHYGIPVFNMQRPDALDRLAAFLKKEGPQPKPSEHWRWHEDGSTPPADGSSVFVFGSNLAGRHGKGAALAAKSLFGAEQGVGRGITGWAYALATKDAQLKSRPINEIAYEALDCLSVASSSPERLFFFSRVGCGLAGFDDQEIAPLFGVAPPNASFANEWRAFLS